MLSTDLKQNVPNDEISANSPSNRRGARDCITLIPCPRKIDNRATLSASVPTNYKALMNLRLGFFS